MTYQILLSIHIISGTIALIGAIVAITTKVYKGSHQLHIIGGNAFFYGMALVFLTTIVLTILKPNLFLFLIGIFSFYLAFSGWRMAVNRSGDAGKVEYIAIAIMLLASLLMIIWGFHLIGNGGNGLPLIVFGFLGGILALVSLKRYRQGSLKGKTRISAHLGHMLGATIATITAVLVVNIQTDPVWIAWIAPTIIITPLIVWLSRRVESGKLKL